MCGTTDEIYDRVLKVVLDVCDPPANWRWCKEQQCVEVRALLIYHLWKNGIDRKRIAIKTGFKKTTIADNLNTFDIKKCGSRILAINCSKIEQVLNG